MNSRHFDIFELTIYFSLISLFIVTVVSFVLNFIYNKCEKMQKINTITSYITLAIFVPLFYKLFKYIIDVYTISYTSSYIIALINVILILLAVIFTTINFITKSKIKLIRKFEIASLLIYLILAITLIFMNFSDKVFIVVTAISLLLCEYFIVNSNENLQDKTSKAIYLTTNIIVSAILIICLLVLVFKISFKFDLTLLIIGLIILIIALIPLLTAYKTLKKEVNND